MLKAYKTELGPNNKQKGFLSQCAGASRVVFNWGLAEWTAWFFDAGIRPVSQERLKKYFNCMIKDENFPWLRDYPYSITEATFINLGRSFDNFWRQRKDGTVQKRITQLKSRGRWAKRVAKTLEKDRPYICAEPGFPRFKRRGDNQSFQLKEFRVYRDRIEIGRRCDVTGIGAIRLKESDYIPVNAQRYGTYATVSQRAGRWFVSVLVQEECQTIKTTGKVVGVDFGINTLATCSNGVVFPNSRPLEQGLRKIRALNKELDRRQQGGANWKKTKKKLARAHFKVSNIRSHLLHQINHYLTHVLRPGVIVLEDLNVSGMMKNRYLARSIADVGFAELRRQIEYKAKWCGIRVVFADRFEPTSKRCSGCGEIKEDLSLTHRVYRCDFCDLVIDRDLNAAINLAALVEP